MTPQAAPPGFKRLPAIGLWKATLGVVCLLVVAGLSGLAVDLLRSRATGEKAWEEALTRRIARLCGPDDRLVVLNNEDSFDAEFRQALTRRVKQQRAVLAWGAALDLDQVPHSSAVLALKLTGAEHGFEEVSSLLAQSPQYWALHSQLRYSFVPNASGEKVVHCEIRKWRAQ
jgi:hypothetical protein